MYSSPRRRRLRRERRKGGSHREWEKKEIKKQRMTKGKIKTGKRLGFGDEEKEGQGGREGPRTTPV